MYVEDLLALNFMINMSLLFLAARLAGKAIARRRLVVGGLLGALYSLVVYLPEPGWTSSWTARLVASLLMVIVTFRPLRVVEIPRLCGALFLAAFFLAGTVFALHFYGGAPAFIRGGVFYVEPPRPGVLFAGVLVAFLLVFGVWHFGERQRARSRLYYELFLHNEGSEVALSAMLDTGNSLCDPLSGKPLCIATYSAVKELLPGELCRAFETGQDPVAALSTLEGRAASRFAVVPYRSLESSGLLVSFRPEAVYLLNGSERRHLKGAVIALTGRKLSADGSLAVLLHPDTLR